jgi:hypothetical protein
VRHRDAGIKKDRSEQPLGKQHQAGDDGEADQAGEKQLHEGRHGIAPRAAALPSERIA